MSATRLIRLGTDKDGIEVYGVAPSSNLPAIVEPEPESKPTLGHLFGLGFLSAVTMLIYGIGH